MYDRAAQRILAQDPWIARDSIYTAVVCGDLHEVLLDWGIPRLSRARAPRPIVDFHKKKGPRDRRGPTLGVPNQQPRPPEERPILQSSFLSSAATTSGCSGMKTCSFATTSWPSRESTSFRNSLTFGSSGLPGALLT